MVVKRCGRCGIDKSVQAFARFSRASDGLQRWCKSCHRQYRQAEYEADPEKFRKRGRDYYHSLPARPDATRRANLRKYGLSTEEFDTMLERQDGRCAVCRTTEPGGKHGQWHVDHDHSCCPGPRTCGKCVRALLCAGCNVGLGHFGDDVGRLMAAASYLLQFQNVLKEAVDG